MKKKKVSSENIQMTKKEREALQAQLEKEREVRGRLEQVNKPVYTRLNPCLYLFKPIEIFMVFLLPFSLFDEC